MLHLALRLGCQRGLRTSFDCQRLLGAIERLFLVQATAIAQVVRPEVVPRAQLLDLKRGHLLNVLFPSFKILLLPSILDSVLLGLEGLDLLHELLVLPVHEGHDVGRLSCLLLELVLLAEAKVLLVLPGFLDQFESAGRFFFRTDGKSAAETRNALISQSS